MPFNRRVFSDGDHEIHFIDEGGGPPILLLHGNPTWSFLWRKVIRILARENVRVIAPDLVGLGLSDKPRDPRVHTLDFHAGRISALVAALDIHDITIAGQDWGGPILGRSINGIKKLFPDAEAVETDAGHFLQEEVPEELAAAVLQVVEEA